MSPRSSPIGPPNSSPTPTWRRRKRGRGLGACLDPDPGQFPFRSHLCQCSRGGRWQAAGLTLQAWGSLGCPGRLSGQCCSWAGGQDGSQVRGQGRVTQRHPALGPWWVGVLLRDQTPRPALALSGCCKTTCRERLRGSGENAPAQALGFRETLSCSLQVVLQPWEQGQRPPPPGALCRVSTCSPLSTAWQDGWVGVAGLGRPLPRPSRRDRVAVFVGSNDVTTRAPGGKRSAPPT